LAIGFILEREVKIEEKEDTRENKNHDLKKKKKKTVS
jgi:hypothetical protein